MGRGKVRTRRNERHPSQGGALLPNGLCDEVIRKTFRNREGKNNGEREGRKRGKDQKKGEIQDGARTSSTDVEGLPAGCLAIGWGTLRRYHRAVVLLIKQQADRKRKKPLE